jgi:hypothetical protein
LKPHSKDHARVERKMIEQVVRRGWLEGKLKREPKPEPTKVERLEKQLKAVDSLIKTWESKERRARNALKKLAARRRHLVRCIEKSSTDEMEAASEQTQESAA